MFIFAMQMYGFYDVITQIDKFVLNLQGVYKSHTLKFRLIKRGPPCI